MMMGRVLTLILVSIWFTPSLIHASVLLTREDCTDLYSMVRGQRSENAIDIFRRISSHGLNLDDIVRLYDYCLRSEDGIRYRRMDPGVRVPMYTAEHHHHPNHPRQQQQQQQEPTEEISWTKTNVNNKVKPNNNDNPENPES